VNEIDLSCLQVLCAAHRSAVASGRDITTTGKWPDAFARAVEESGYSRGRNCRSPRSVRCLWNSGGCA
jgi:hypothetical protein